MKNGIRGYKKSCSPATVKSDEEKVNLMRLYNPAMQVKYCSYPARCVMGKAPTLAKVRKEYGEQVALDWLKVQINDYQNFVAVKGENELPDETEREMAALILGDWYFLKMTEIMLFFRWLKTGRYGELYGRINPQSFFCKLLEFVKDRNNIIFHEESEKRKLEDEESRKKSVSYADYKKKLEKK